MSGWTIASAVSTAAATAGLGCVIAAAVSDVRHFEIPDGLSIALAVLVVPFGLATGSSFGWIEHIGTGVVVFGICAALFARGWLGGGDVKLLAACALWCGFSGLPALMLGTTVSGGVLAAVALTGRRLAGDAAHPYPALRADGPLPYAVAILGGVVTWGFNFL